MKTARGTYYYIRVGTAFYAGEQPVKVERYVEVPDPEELRRRKKEFGLPAYRFRETNRGTGWSNNFTRTRKGRMFNHHAKYADLRMPTKSVLVEFHTGNYIEQWTDDQAKAKKFRLQSKALAKAEEIAKTNGMVDKRPIVEFYGGE